MTSVIKRQRLTKPVLLENIISRLAIEAAKLFHPNGSS